MYWSRSTIGRSGTSQQFVAVDLLILNILYWLSARSIEQKFPVRSFEILCRRMERDFNLDRSCFIPRKERICAMGQSDRTDPFSFGPKFPDILVLAEWSNGTVNFRSNRSNREKRSTSKGGPVFWTFSRWTEPINSVLNRKFQKF